MVAAPGAVRPGTVQMLNVAVTGSAGVLRSLLARAVGGGDPRDVADRVTVGGLQGSHSGTP